jgi:predicted acetyltransferase
VTTTDQAPTTGPVLVLEAPSIRYRQDFLAMAREYLVHGNEGERALYEEAIHDVAAHIRLLEDRARGRCLLEGQVPYRSFWLIRDGRTIVATSTLRRWLTPQLLIEGGNIGYGTRPSERGKGYGRAVCALTLREARDTGMKRVLITCNTENVASATIILACGGRFEGESPSPRTGKPVSRYWIEL